VSVGDVYVEPDVKGEGGEFKLLDGTRAVVLRRGEDGTCGDGGKEAAVTGAPRIDAGPRGGGNVAAGLSVVGDDVSIEASFCRRETGPESAVDRAVGTPALTDESNSDESRCEGIVIWFECGALKVAMLDSEECVDDAADDKENPRPFCIRPPM
jgi:hypothetical protein